MAERLRIHEVARANGDISVVTDGAATVESKHVSLSNDALIDETKRGPTWHPFWLRPAILTSLASIFLAVTITSQVILNLSQRNDGLSEARAAYVYTWRFGPTAGTSCYSLVNEVNQLTASLTVLTLITIFWTRVEAQALRYMPWIALELGAQADDDLHNLDYPQMFLPSVLFQSLRRKHFLVFFTSITTTLLRVQIILSPNIFDSSTVEVTTPREVRVWDSFVIPEDRASPDKFSPADSVQSPYLPYNHARALQDLNIKPPFGMTSEFVYQTFGPLAADHNEIRATVDTRIKTVVDGLFIDMKCLMLEEYHTYGPEQIGESADAYDITIDLKFEGCPAVISTTHGYGRLGEGVEPYENSLYSYSSDVKNWNCSSLPHQHPRIFYFLADYLHSDEDLPQLIRQAGVICSPTTWMSRVEITDDGSDSPNFTTLPGPEAHAENIDLDIWTLLTQSIPDGWADLEFLEASTIFSDFFPFGGRRMPLKSDWLRRVIVTMTKALGLMIAHYRVRQSGEDRASGISIVTESRLFAIPAVCIAMAVLSGLCTCLAAWTAFTMKGVRMTWHRPPSTTLGWAIFLSKHNTTSNHPISRASLVEQGTSKVQWTDFDYTPFALRPMLRAFLVSFEVGVAVALIVTLKESSKSDGLMTLDGYGRTPLLWKSIPTLLVLLIAMYSNASDTAIRSLAMFHRLSEETCNVHELDMSLVDMLGLRAIYHSLHLRIPAVTLSQVIATICAFLTTIASALFTPESIPGLSSTSIRPQSWFGAQRSLGELNITRTDEQGWSLDYPDFTKFNEGRERLRPLYRVQNEVSLVYPRNTYLDLVFPAFSTEDLRLDDRSLVKVNIPAAKLNPVCHRLDEGVDFSLATNISANTTTMFLLNEAASPLAWLELGWNQWKSNGSASTAYGAASRLDNVTYMDQFTKEIISGPVSGHEVILATEYKPWRSETYAWGRFALSNHEIGHLSAWRCNYTWTEVPTIMTLTNIDGELQIDKDHPPETDESKARPWLPSFDVPQFETFGHLEEAFPQDDGDLLITRESQYLLAREFWSLLEANRSVTVEDLMDPNREDFVLESLTKQLGIIGAQLANIEHRLALNQTSVSEPHHYGELPLIKVTVVDETRRRLVQSPAITYVLLAIILLVVVVNAWALVSSWLIRYRPGKGEDWLLNLEFRGLAPEKYNSMATMDALLQGSNVNNHIPDNSHELPTATLIDAMAGKRFRMGWFYNHHTQMRVFTIGVLDDPGFEALNGSDE